MALGICNNVLRHGNYFPGRVDIAIASDYMLCEQPEILGKYHYFMCCY